VITKEIKMQNELNQLMLEHEEFLEKALDDMEFSNEFLSQEQVDCIRQACGKPRNSHVNPLLRDVINDFGNILVPQNRSINLKFNIGSHNIEKK
jgi:hypothetical protein